MRGGALLGLLLASGCVTVQPWQREEQARRSMTQRFGEERQAGRYRAKILETKAGGGSVWSVPGGGCGCSQ